jgi:hypothetical protein
MAKSFPTGTSLTTNTGEEWTKEGGAIPVVTYEGNVDEILAQYNTQKTLGMAYGDPRLASLGYEANKGRARLIMRYVRENQNVEELYAVDVIRDIREANYFSTLTDAQITAVKVVDENNGAEVAGWVALQKTLFKHLRHGASSYVDKQFILRTSSFVSMASLIEADLSNVGTVVSTPTLSADMQRLIKTLPSGEWLQGPMSAEHLGRGRWRLDNELQWAKKWSIIYGGTLFAP